MPDPKPSHGGARQAGPGKKIGRPKKADKKIGASIAVSPDVLEFLDSTGARSQTIENAIRKTKAFRDWKKSSGE